MHCVIHQSTIPNFTNNQNTCNNKGRRSHKTLSGNEWRSMAPHSAAMLSFICLLYACVFSLLSAVQSSSCPITGLHLAIHNLLYTHTFLTTEWNVNLFMHDLGLLEEVHTSRQGKCTNHFFHWVALSSSWHLEIPVLLRNMVQVEHICVQVSHLN